MNPSYASNWRKGQRLARFILSVSTLFGLLAQPLLTTAAVLPSEPAIPGTSPLELIKSVNPANDTGYVLSYKNAGGITLFNVVITDKLPTTSSFMSASNGGTYDPVSHSVSWNIGTLPGHTDGTVSLDTSFDFGALTECVSVTNTANIRGVGPASTPEDDGIVEDTTSTTQRFCPKNPDLQVDKKIAENGEKLTGITYVINYANTGNWPAYNVVLNDVLPHGATIASSTPTPDSVNNGVATWTIPMLDIGETGSISLTVTIDASVLTCERLVNTADIEQVLPAPVPSSQDVPYPERNLDDNRSTATTEHFFGLCQGSISGGKWNDENENTNWDNQENGIEHWTVELLTTCSQDINEYDYYDNDIIDLSDFVAWTQGFQNFNPNVDLNHDGVISRLDLACFGIPFSNGGNLTGSPTVIATTHTAVDGSYAFSPAYAGTYFVREVMQPDWTQSFPGTPSAMHGPISLGFGETIANLNFGNYQASGENEGDPTLTPKLTLEKSANASIQAAGGTITYFLTLNVSDANAEDVIVSDPLPEHLTFVEASSGSSYDAATRTVTWSLGTLSPNSYVLSVTTQVDATVQDNTIVINTANVRAKGVDSFEASADVTLTSSPKLTIEKTANRESAHPGSVVTYTVKVKNSGSDAATNVVLTDTLPTSFTFSDSDSTTMAKMLGTIPAGESITTTYEAKVAPSASAGTYDNIARVSADGLDPLSSTARVAVVVGSVLGAEDTNDDETPATNGQVLGAEDTLPETGPGALDALLALLGLSFLVAGASLLRRSRLLE